MHACIEQQRFDSWLLRRRAQKTLLKPLAEWQESYAAGFPEHCRMHIRYNLQHQTARLTASAPRAPTGRFLLYTAEVFSRFMMQRKSSWSHSCMQCLLCTAHCPVSRTAMQILAHYIRKQSTWEYVFPDAGCGRSVPIIPINTTHVQLQHCDRLGKSQPYH